MTTAWSEEIAWYYTRADGELGVRGMAFEGSGVPQPPHERSSPARDSRPGEETPAEKDRRIREIMAALPAAQARILQRYYAWEPNLARMTIQERTGAAVEKVRLSKVGALMARTGAKPGALDITRAVNAAHEAYEAERKAWRRRDDEDREARRRATLAWLRGERAA